MSATRVHNPRFEQGRAEQWQRKAEALEKQLREAGIEPTTEVAAPVSTKKARQAHANGATGGAMDKLYGDDRLEIGDTYNVPGTNIFVKRMAGPPPGSRALQFAAALNRRLGKAAGAQAAEDRRTLKIDGTVEQRQMIGAVGGKAGGAPKVLPQHVGEETEADESSLRMAMIELK